MPKRIITISREFGSGGRTVGKHVAEKLGIKYYDKDIVRHVARETGFDEAFIEDKGEHTASRSWLSSVFSARSINGAMSRGMPHAMHAIHVHNHMSIEDVVWAVQCRIIIELAEKEPCVIVGRCADYILKKRTDCLNVFIHADLEARADRIVRLYGESENSPEKRLYDKDKRRSAYYKHYTDREWGMAENYHLSMNSHIIGIDKCVDIITDLYLAAQEN